MTAGMAVFGLGLLQMQINGAIYSYDSPSGTIPHSLFDDFGTVSQLWAPCFCHIARIFESRPKDMNLNYHSGVCYLLSNTISCWMDYVMAILKSHPEGQELDMSLAIPMFNALEKFHAAYAVVVSYHDSVFGIRDNLARSFLQNGVLGHIYGGLSEITMRQGFLANEKNAVFQAGAKTMQNACKASLATFTSPTLELFRNCYPVAHWEQSSIDNFAVSPVYYSLTYPHFALGMTLDCLTSVLLHHMANRHLRPSIDDLEEQGIALVLQMLHVIANLPTEMEAVFGTVLKEPRCLVFDYWQGWVEACVQFLPVVATELEPGLERLLRLVSMRVKSRGKFQELESFVDPLSKLITDLKKADPNNEVVLRKRAQVLSHLQCANLNCITPICPWDKNKSKLCAGCKLVHYCSAKCQKADWKGHKKACKLIAAQA